VFGLGANVSHSFRNVLRERLFTPGETVNYLLNVLDGLKPAQSGQFLAFDGEWLPW